MQLVISFICKSVKLKYNYQLNCLPPFALHGAGNKVSIVVYLPPRPGVVSVPPTTMAPDRGNEK